jgi:hypothetical protein
VTFSISDSINSSVNSSVISNISVSAENVGEFNFSDKMVPEKGNNRIYWKRE